MKLQSAGISHLPKGAKALAAMGQRDAPPSACAWRRPGTIGPIVLLYPFCRILHQGS
jgi:hypothetical protein